MVPDMPFLAQLVYREYHTRVQALQNTQKLVPPPEDVLPSFRPPQEESVPIEQDGTEMEVVDLSEEKTESIPVELENQQLPIESEMSVTTETVPVTETYTSTNEEETVKEKQEAANQQVTETETEIEPMEQ